MAKQVSSVSLRVSGTILIFILWFVFMVAHSIFFSGDFGRIENVGLILVSLVLFMLAVTYLWLPLLEKEQSPKRVARRKRSARKSRRRRRR